MTVYLTGLIIVLVIFCCVGKLLWWLIFTRNDGYGNYLP